MVKLEDADSIRVGSFVVPTIYDDEDVVYTTEVDSTDYTDLADTALIWLKLDETTDVAAANDGTLGNGTYQNITPSTDSVSGLATPVTSTAIDLTGASSDYVEVSDTITATNWTISVWVKAESLTDDQYICDTSDETAGLICGFQDNYYNIYGSGYPTGASIASRMEMSAQGTKDHVVYTKDGSTITGYVNGSERISVTATTPANFEISATALRLGRYYGASQNYFSGVMDEFMLFGSALTPQQVTLLFTGTAGDPPVEPEDDADYFVATTSDTPAGHQDNDGSVDSPWTLESVLNGTNTASISAGDTIALRAGTHTRNGVGSFNVDGSSGNPITFRPFIGEHASIDLHNTSAANTTSTNLYINGDYVTFQGIEFKSTSTSSRYTSTAGASPPWSTGVWRGGVVNAGSYNKYIHCIFHDLRLGWSQFSNQTPTPKGTEFYGNVVYNNGWISTDGGHGHGSYFSHDGNGSAAEFITYKDNIVFSNFAFGLQCYGGKETPEIQIRGVNLIGNTWFYAGAAPGDDYLNQSLNQDVLVGKTDNGSGDVADIVVTDNCVYSDEGRPESSSSREVEFGWNYGSVTHDDISLTDNYFASRLYFWAGAGNSYPWTTITASGNSVVRDAASTGYVLNGNTVSSGITVVTDKTTPNNPTPFVRVSDHDSSRGIATVYNWQGLASVSVDLSSILADGAEYEIIDTARIDHYLAGEVTANWGQVGTFDSASPNVDITMGARDLPEIYRLTSDSNYNSTPGVTYITDAVSLPATFGAYLIKTV